MKWPLANSGATYLRYVTDTVHTVQYSDGQCTVQVYTQLPPVFETQQTHLVC